MFFPKHPKQKHDGSGALLLNFGAYGQEVELAAFSSSGERVLTVRLHPLPTGRATAAIAERCEHLTATQTRYPGTDPVLRHEVKPAPDRTRNIAPCPESWWLHGGFKSLLRRVSGCW